MKELFYEWWNSEDIRHSIRACTSTNDDEFAWYAWWAGINAAEQKSNVLRYGLIVSACLNIILLILWLT